MSEADQVDRSPGVLITGATGTLGRAFVKAFSSADYFVGIHYHQEKEQAEEMLLELTRAGGRGDLLGGDLTDSDSTFEGVREFLGRHSNIDVLINNVGTTQDRLFLFVDDASWREVLDVNLTSLHAITQCAVRSMIPRKRGSIINVSSISALRGLPGQSAYAAAKAGVHGFTRAMARECGRFGVRVNALAPGAIESPMVDEVSAEQRQWLEDAACLRRLGRPEEIAKVALFLASDAASFITGQVIVADGGVV